MRERTKLFLLVAAFLAAYFLPIESPRVQAASLEGNWFLLKDYQKDRIHTFLDPDLAARGAGYQVRQARIAIGSGGVFGKGFKQGTQSRLGFLPVRHTDLRGINHAIFCNCGIVIEGNIFGKNLYTIKFASVDKPTKPSDSPPPP